MANVISNPFGELRGSLGPLTFTSNASGAQVRLKTMQHNSNYPFQIQNRRNLTFVSSIYRRLTVIQKNEWKYFAQHVFTPLKPSISGKYTAPNSFVSCNVNLLISGQNYVDPIIYDLLAHTALPHTQRILAVCPSAPSFPCSDSIAAGSGLFYPIRLSNLSGSAGVRVPYIFFSHDGHFQVMLYWYNIPSILNSSQIIDSNGNFIGFNIYLSDKLKSSGQVPSNYFRSLLVSSGIFDVTGPDFTNSLGVNLQWSDIPNFYNGKYHFRSGDIYVISVVAFSMNGTQRLCDRLEYSVL